MKVWDPVTQVVSSWTAYKESAVLTEVPKKLSFFTIYGCRADFCYLYWLKRSINLWLITHGRAVAPGGPQPADPLTRRPSDRLTDRLAGSRLTRADRRAEPRVGQRVPYAVVYGAPGLPLIELVRTPAELLADPALRLNAEYYVSRAVAPPLQRCLGLLGVDVLAWYAAVPRRLRLPPPAAAAAAATISRFFAGRSCAVCARASARPVCAECASHPVRTRLTLEGTVRRRERALAAVREVSLPTEQCASVIRAVITCWYIAGVVAMVFQILYSDEGCLTTFLA